MLPSTNTSGSNRSIVHTSRELQGNSYCFVRFIFYLFGIIAGVGAAGIMITEALHHFLTSRQLLVCHHEMTSITVIQISALPPIIISKSSRYVTF